jgi:hypothetical protein
MWGIWDRKEKCWVEEWGGEFGMDYPLGIVVFKSKAMACKRAAHVFGYDSYTEAKKRGACVVAPLCRSLMPNPRPE